jgi:hypothetical protein
MSLIQSNGYLTGAAASLLSAMSAGTFFWLGGEDYQLVTVTGQSPAAGKVFAHRLRDGRVVQLDDTQRAGSQAVGAFAFVSVAAVILDEGNALAADTLGDLPAGALYDTGTTTTPNGQAARKIVEVQDGDGVPISAGGGNSWRLVLQGTAVEAVADSTVVESWGAAGATAYKIQ